MNNISRIKEYKIIFWTPGTKLQRNQQYFGCVSHGFATSSSWIEPEMVKYSIWEEPISGALFYGDYDNVLNNLKNCGFTPKICITFFRKSLGMEHFIRRFRELFPTVPIIGGKEATGESQYIDDILQTDEEVMLLAAAEGEFELETLNIYDKTEIEVEITKTSDREFDRIKLRPDGKWQPAIDFYRQQQKIRGINRDDFESLTFQDMNGRNIHCSIKETQIVTGANLPNDCRLTFCVVDRRDAKQRLEAFLLKERSLIIGCAGIRSLIQEPLKTGNHTLAGFLFGEVVTCNNEPMFGNLMLARLTCK